MEFVDKFYKSVKIKSGLREIKIEDGFENDDVYISNCLVWGEFN